MIFIQMGVLVVTQFVTCHKQEGVKGSTFIFSLIIIFLEFVPTEVPGGTECHTVTTIRNTHTSEVGSTFFPSMVRTTQYKILCCVCN